MPNLTAVIGADTSKFVAEMKKAKDSLDKFMAQTKKTGNTSGVANEQVAAYQRVVNSLNKVASGSMDTAKAERTLKKEIKELKIQWANLNSTARSSDFGKSISESCRVASAQLKTLQTQMRQAANEVNNAKAKMSKGGSGGGGFGLDGLLGGLGKGMAMKGVAMATGIGSVAVAATQAVDALKDGAVATMGFNSKQSQLQAVTGKSAGELQALTDQALKLGSTTRYTASEIAGLQIELAKLGFNPQEIENMTVSVQNLATATGTDLASAASLTGASLRMFGLQSEDAGRVADVFAKSCSASALSFDYLNSAMSTVGPVANSFGISIEDTVGLLGVLANAGFDASSAATATRNIILNLADSNSKLSKSIGGPVKSGQEMLVALKGLEKGGTDLATALELTDKRSVAAFQTMLQNAQSGYELIDVLNNCSGAAQQMSDVMSDNLEGDLAGLGSAWEGLMLQLGGGQSILRTLVQALTKVIQKVQECVTAITEWATNLYDNSVVVRAILQAIVVNFEMSFNAIVYVVKTAMNNIKGFFTVIGKVLEGDFSGAVDAWKSMLDTNIKNTKEFVNKQKTVITDAWDAVANGRKKDAEKILDSAPQSSGSDWDESKIKAHKAVTGDDKGKGKNKKKDPAEGSLGDLEKKLQKLKEDYRNGWDPNLNSETFLQQVNALENQIKAKKLEMGIDFMPGSLEALEEDIAKLKRDYNKGWRPDLNSKTFNKELKKAERAIRNKKIELGLKAEFTREMQDDLAHEIKEKEYELSITVDEDSKKKIAEDLEKLLHMKAQVDQVVGIKGRVDGILIDEGELTKIGDKVNSEFQKKLSQKYDLIQFPPDPTKGLTKWRKKAEDMLKAMEFYTPELKLGTNVPIKGHSLADQLSYEQSVVESLQSAYDKYIYDLQKTANLTTEETQIVRQYVDVASDLSVAYENCKKIEEKLKQTGGELTEEDRKQVKIATELAARTNELKAAYDKLVASKENFLGISDADIAAIREYKTASANVKILSNEYKKASDQVYEFNRKAMISERTWDATKNGISIIGDLSSAAQNCGGAWKKMGEDWDKMTAFEKTTAVIDNTINSIESLISIYEKIMDTIKLFGEISELAAAKKVAADAAVTASGEAQTAAETANTATTVANTQMETQAKTAALGVDQAKALSSATASGASLPFPANIAAIAAGIAAVVAAFAMVFSCFAEGGIVSGGSHVGDNQIVRVNSGEMILNGQQQKRLFNLLNGTGSRNGNNVGEGGEVTFHIRGNDLYGVLTNRNKKVSKI